MLGWKLKNVILVSLFYIFLFKCIIGLFTVIGIALAWSLSMIATIIIDYVFEFELFFNEEENSSDEYDRGPFYI